MKKNPTDKVAWQAAHDITDVTKQGEDIARAAVLSASEQMPKMLQNVGSRDAKIEMLKHHALYLGVAARLRREILPLADKMVDDLTELTGDKNHAELMSEVWLAKAVRDIVKGVKDAEAKE